VAGYTTRQLPAHRWSPIVGGDVKHYTTNHQRSPIQVLTGPDVEYTDRDQRATTKPGHHTW